MTSAERVPWPFPGPNYDWTTEDELGSLGGQIRQAARSFTGPQRHDLEQIADDLDRARRHVVTHGQMPDEDDD